MKKISVSLKPQPPHSYPIFIGKKLLKNIKQWLSKPSQYDHFVIITDNNVKKRYGNTLLKHLITQGYPAKLFAFPAGEKSKQQQTKQNLEAKMLHAGMNRNTLCLALGGGVVGDLAGFLSATYMRGIPYIQIPTTLLAMVDSSVGGKTAIDTDDGKNLIGAFWQPQAVVADLTCLKDLPQKQFVNGLIEALKMFLTSDVESFRYAVKNLQKILARDEKPLQEIIHRAITIKARVVEKDEKESDLRMVLNFGHTIAHALEKVTGYKMLHGYAVAYGILIEAEISKLLGILDMSDYLAIQQVFVELDISGDALKKININKLIQATQTDKKVKGGNARYILLKSLGQVYEKQNIFAHVVPDYIVKQAFYNTIG